VSHVAMQGICNAQKSGDYERHLVEDIVPIKMEVQCFWNFLHTERLCFCWSKWH